MSGLDTRALGADSSLTKKPAPAAKQEFRVFLAEEAFDHCVSRGGADTTREVGGVLVGEVCRDENGPYVRIETAVDALHAEEKGAELTFTHATWEHINKELDTKHAGKKVVGWWHTHPGFGVFLSDRDQFIHRSFFNLPFQVALVYDPKSREHGVFVWRDNEPWRARRYYIGDREQTWDAARVAAAKDVKELEQKKKEAKVANADGDDGRTREETGPDWTMLAIVGLITLLVGGFIGYMAGGRSGGAVRQSGQTAMSQSDAAQTAILLSRHMNAEVIGAVQRALEDEHTNKPLAAALESMDQSIKTLEAKATTDPAIGDAVSKLKAQRDVLAAALRRRASAAKVLDELEQLGDLDARSIASELSRQRRFTAVLYKELAAEVEKTDPKRAKSLLDRAALIDPDVVKPKADEAPKPEAPAPAPEAPKPAEAAKPSEGKAP